MTTLICWNIQQGGGSRLPRIVEELSAYDPDVIALTGFRTQPGIALCASLKERGWPNVETTNPAVNQNGIAVFSRAPMRRTRPCPAPPADVARWLDIDLPEYGFGIGVLHIMAATAAASNAAKTRFWDTVLGAAAERVNEPFLFIGHWNTGLHRIDETGKTYVCAEHFARLSALGWTDAWRRHNPGGTEFTWYSKVKGGVRGNGFRVDHAFATPSLLPRIASCRYSHAEREAKVSDHSMVIVELD
jgi:exodeoxyribonuclease-3